MKKRYQLTLTRENVEKFQDIANRLNMPQNILSYTVDEYLLNLSEAMESLLETDSITAGDFFTVLGNQLKKLEVQQNDEAKVHEGKEKKKNRKVA